eukprot:m.5303 g.5303  ORF g.5303 m.5303 type:complete len:163 (+) comp4496_c0_seq1:14-502(+)
MGSEVALVSTRCSETGRLNLHGCKLMALPEAVFFLLRPAAETLVEIDLSANLLKRFSPKLCLFPALQTLIIHSNKISALPDELPLLTSLQTLDFSDCQFEEFPAVIHSVPTLTLVRCNNNRIAHVDPAALHASPLQRLELSGNPISPEALLALQSGPVTVHF